MSSAAPSYYLYSKDPVSAITSICLALDQCTSMLAILEELTDDSLDFYDDSEAARMNIYEACRVHKYVYDMICVVHGIVSPLVDMLDDITLDINAKPKIPVRDINIDKIHDKRRTPAEDTPQAPTLSTNPPTVSDYPWMDPYPTTPNPAA